MLSHHLRRAAAGAGPAPSGFNAKSIIFDCANNYGSVILGIRSIEFIDGVAVITNNDTLSTSYATTEGGVGALAGFAFDTSLSKIGSSTLTAWQAAFLQTTNQRLINVLNDPIDFTGITVNNFHTNGSGTDRGVQNVKIYISDDAITDTVYGNPISNSTLIFDGTLAEHVAADVIDDQILTLI